MAEVRRFRYPKAWRIADVAASAAIGLLFIIPALMHPESLLSDPWGAVLLFVLVGAFAGFAFWHLHLQREIVVTDTHICSRGMPFLRSCIAFADITEFTLRRQWIQDWLRNVDTFVVGAGNARLSFRSYIENVDELIAIIEEKIHMSPVLDASSADPPQL